MKPSFEEGPSAKEGASPEDAVPSPSAMTIDELLVRGTPFIDLRSPSEFAAGAVPGAVNLPLLTDDERHQVGLIYKQSGASAAMARGHELVHGPIREARLSSWRTFALDNPGAWLYCWRGGLRSETAQRWLAEAGIDVPRLDGGFKALRQRCLQIIASAPAQLPWLVLGGRTGTGKTQLLNQLAASIDLEGRANHRGSAFGARLTPQPSPIAFENALAIDYLHRHLRGGAKALLLEDESRTIGRLAVPKSWHDAMQQAPLAILELDLSDRANNICREYVWQPLAAGVAATTLAGHYQAALNRISKRLGGVRTREVAAMLAAGFEHGDHGPWIERLLEWYYDPMYDYQLSKKLDRVQFRGGSAAMLAFLGEFSVSGGGHDRGDDSATL